MFKVSILVPIFGVEQYIERCSRSLFEQSYRNLEFVFVNDCTPDRSIAVLKEVMADYPDRKGIVKIIEHEKNKGLAASRNTGLDNSTGDFVFCVDSDDWLEADAIEQMVRGQMENDADIVTGGYLVHNDDGSTQLREAKLYKDKEQMVLQMMQRTWEHFVAGRLLRRSLFVKNALRWKDGFDVAEDRFMMTMLAYQSNRFNTVNDVVYHYERRNCNALTKIDDGQKAIKNNKQELENILSLEQFFVDKETVYQKECARCVMDQLEYNRQVTLAYSAKEEFYCVVSLMDDRDDSDLQLFGWMKNGLKGWWQHSYGYSSLSYKMRKAIRVIRKRMKVVFGEN